MKLTEDTPVFFFFLLWEIAEIIPPVYFLLDGGGKYIIKGCDLFTLRSANNVVLSAQAVSLPCISKSTRF